MFPCATPAARPLPNTQHVTLFVVCCHQGNAPHNIMLPACSHFRYAALTIVGDSAQQRATLHAQHVDDRFKGAGITQRWKEVNPTSHALQEALKKVVDFVSQRGQLAPACVVVYYSGPVALSHGACKLCSNPRPPCAWYSWHNMVCVCVCAMSLPADRSKVEQLCPVGEEEQAHLLKHIRNYLKDMKLLLVLLVDGYAQPRRGSTAEYKPSGGDGSQPHFYLKLEHVNGGMYGWRGGQATQGCSLLLTMALLYRQAHRAPLCSQVCHHRT